MTAELKFLYDQVKDWSSWDPPGGRSWYDSVTDPDPKEGLLVQLQMIVDELRKCYTDYSAVVDQFTKVYQLSRKMSDDADELDKRMTGNPFILKLVETVEKAMIEKNPDAKGFYSLNRFIIMQKMYLDQITYYFHDAVTKDKCKGIYKERLTFYENILKICSAHIDVVNAVHIFNSVELRLKKSAAREYARAVNIMMEALAGWNADNVEKRFEVNDATTKLVTELFKADIDKQLADRGIARHIQRIVKKSKDYVKIAKDLKRRIHDDPEFWKKSASELIIRDGLPETSK